MARAQKRSRAIANALNWLEGHLLETTFVVLLVLVVIGFGVLIYFVATNDSTTAIEKAHCLETGRRWVFAYYRRAHVSSFDVYVPHYVCME